MHVLKDEGKLYTQQGESPARILVPVGPELFRRQGDTNHWAECSGESISAGLDEMQREFAERADWMVE